MRIFQVQEKYQETEEGEQEHDELQVRSSLTRHFPHQQVVYFLHCRPSERRQR